jgi:hypothetical protein
MKASSPDTNCRSVSAVVLPLASQAQDAPSTAPSMRTRLPCTRGGQPRMHGDAASSPGARGEGAAPAPALCVACAARRPRARPPRGPRPPSRRRPSGAARRPARLHKSRYSENETHSKPAHVTMHLCYTRRGSARPSERACHGLLRAGRRERLRLDRGDARAARVVRGHVHLNKRRERRVKFTVKYQSHSASLLMERHFHDVRRRTTMRAMNSCTFKLFYIIIFLIDI